MREGLIKNKKFMSQRKFKKQKGYITLLIMLLVSAVSFTIILSVLRSSTSSSQSALAILQGAQARAYANTCAEDALYAIKNDPVATKDLLGVPQEARDFCTFEILTTDYPANPSTWSFRATSVSGAETIAYLTITAKRSGSNLTVTAWDETPPVVE